MVEVDKRSMLPCIVLRLPSVYPPWNHHGNQSLALGWMRFFIGSLRMKQKPTEINTGILRSLINVSHLIINNGVELTPAQTPQINSLTIHNNALKEREQTFNKRHCNVSSLSGCGWNRRVRWGIANNVKLIHKVTMLYHSPGFCFQSLSFFLVVCGSSFVCPRGWSETIVYGPCCTITICSFNIPNSYHCMLFGY